MLNECNWGFALKISNLFPTNYIGNSNLHRMLTAVVRDVVEHSGPQWTACSTRICMHGHSSSLYGSPNSHNIISVLCSRSKMFAITSCGRQYWLPSCNWRSQDRSGLKTHQTNSSKHLNFRERREWTLVQCHAHITGLYFSFASQTTSTWDRM